MDRADEVAALAPLAKRHPLYGLDPDQLVCPLTGIDLTNDRWRGGAVTTWERKLPTAWGWRTRSTAAGVVEVGYVPLFYQWYEMHVSPQVAQKAQELAIDAAAGMRYTHCFHCEQPVDYDADDLTTHPRDDEVIAHFGCLVDHEYDLYRDHQERQAEEQHAAEPDFDYSNAEIEREERQYEAWLDRQGGSL